VVEALQSEVDLDIPVIGIREVGVDWSRHTVVTQRLET
jgi:hypothetical protein